MLGDTIRIGVAGCGWIAENAHLPAYIGREDAKVVSLFDSDLNRALLLSTHFGVKNVFDGYDHFLQSGIDAVIITTPNYIHGRYALQALENGKSILCEKPFTIQSRETEAIIATAQKSQTIAIPGFVNRFRDDIQMIAEIIKKGRIGTIQKIEAGWIRRAGVPRPGTWFTNKKLSGGGVLIDLGSHILDICMMFAGFGEIKDLALKTHYNPTANSRSSANWFRSDADPLLPIDVEDTAVANIKLGQGTEINVKLSWSAPVKGDITYFKLCGETGVIQLKTLFGFSDQRLLPEDTLIIREGNREEQIPLNPETNNTRKAFGKMAEFFVKGVASGEKSEYLNTNDGYYTVKLIEELYKHETRNQSIEILDWGEKID